jgi:UPF0755 protein
VSVLQRRRPDPLDDWHDDPWDTVEVVEAPVVERTRRPLRPLKWLAWLAAFALVAGVLTFGGVGWWYLQQINPPGEPLEPVGFTITEDDTFDSVTARLHDEGFIVNPSVFRWYVERQGGLELVPGFYVVTPLDHMGSILDTLATPPEETFTSVTFPEGFTMAKMADRLAATVPTITADEFLAAVTSGQVRSEFQPEGVTSLEGLLFPDTYQVSNGESADRVAARMVALMERVGRQEEIVVRGYVLGLTAYQVLTIASMVEREAKVDDDRALIARVIINRFKRGMPLQIDATLYYGQDPSTPFAELKAIDSPYNTYLYAGLPPTPIANPGRASIEAVVNPAPNPPAGGALCVGVPRNECEYLYYVLADEDGRHAFAVTYDQHLANVEKALQAGLL